MDKAPAPKKRPPLDERVLAACVQHEWGDVLFPDRCHTLEEYYHDPKSTEGKFLPSPFFGRVAGFLHIQLINHGITVSNAVEIGGGSGRFAHEFLKRQEHPTAYIHSDASPEKVELAAWIYSIVPTPRRLAIPGSQLEVQHRTLPSPMIPTDPHAFITAPRTLESPQWHGTQADLMVCLNVIDHVTHPAEFLEKLRGLVRPGGVLLLASPLDWHAVYTEAPHWVDNMHDLVDPSQWRTLAEESFVFPFSTRPRRIILFNSQVLLLQSLPTNSGAPTS